MPHDRRERLRAQVDCRDLALDQAGVQLVTSSFVAGAARGGVEITHALSGRATAVPDCAAVIWTGMRTARNTCCAR